MHTESDTVHANWQGPKAQYEQRDTKSAAERISGHDEDNGSVDRNWIQTPGVSTGKKNQAPRKTFDCGKWRLSAWNRSGTLETNPCHGNRLDQECTANNQQNTWKIPWRDSTRSNSDGQNTQRELIARPRNKNWLLRSKENNKEESNSTLKMEESIFYCTLTRLHRIYRSHRSPFLFWLLEWKWVLVYRLKIEKWQEAAFTLRSYIYAQIKD
jgi:hypothetical protein